MIILLSLLNITFNSAQENEKYSKSGWVSDSRRSANSIISEIIEKSDFTEKIEIIKLLGLRKDRDFNSIIENIYYKKSKTENEKEILIYFCLNSFIKSEADFETNKRIFSEIFSNVVIFSDSLLRKEIIKKTDFAPGKTAVETLSSEGRILAEKSRENGRLDEITAEECRIFIKHSEKYGEPVLEQIIDIIHRNAVNINY